MVDKIEIVTTIAGADQAISLTEIARILKAPAAGMGPQISRLKKDGLLTETDKDKYVLSEKGEEWLQGEKDKAAKLLKSTMPSAGMGDRKERGSPENPPSDEDQDNASGTPPVGNPKIQEPNPTNEAFPSEVDAGLDDLNVFYQLGLQVGVEKQLCQVVTRHVWKGGKYNDLDWVHKAFGEMVVRADLADRWWQAWRTHLGANVAGELITKVRKEGANSEKAIEADSGQPGNSAARNIEDFKKTLTHSIIDGVPKFMGEGEGDMPYEDAKKLCEIQAASKAKAGAVASVAPAAPVDPMTNALTILEKLVPLLKGDNTGRPRSFMVKPSEDGGAPEIEEIDPDKPIVAPAAHAQQQPGKTFIVDAEGTIEEIEPGRPYVKVVKEKAVVPANIGGQPPGQILFFNPTTQAIESWDPSKGPFMMPRPAAPVNQQPVIQMKGADGNLMTLDLSTYFQLDEHKQKMEQQAETHNMKMGVGKEVRSLLSKGIRAFSRMAGEEEPEEFEQEPPPPPPDEGLPPPDPSGDAQ